MLCRFERGTWTHTTCWSEIVAPKWPYEHGTASTGLLTCKIKASIHLWAWEPGKSRNTWRQDNKNANVTTNDFGLESYDAAKRHILGHLGLVNTTNKTTNKQTINKQQRNKQTNKTTNKRNNKQTKQQTNETTNKQTTKQQKINHNKNVAQKPPEAKKRSGKHEKAFWQTVRKQAAKWLPELLSSESMNLLTCDLASLSGVGMRPLAPLVVSTGSNDNHWVLTASYNCSTRSFQNQRPQRMSRYAVQSTKSRKKTWHGRLLFVVGYNYSCKNNGHHCCFC